jgi:uncharacterized membrane protein YdjX (TVP38/TMEM64 family)
MPWRTALLTRRGDRRWDWLIYTTGAAGLLGISLILLLPRSVVLVWFAVMSLPANSPLSPIIPAAFEPLIMEAAKYEHALVVSSIGLGAYLYTEYLNFQFYRWLLDRDWLRGLRDGRWTAWGVARFARAPFSTVAIFAFTPLPFWVARCLAILHGYSKPRYFAATAIGRLPRFMIYAWLGAVLEVPGLVLLAVLLGSTVLVVAWKLSRDERLVVDPGLDRAPAEPPRSL